MRHLNYKALALGLVLGFVVAVVPSCGTTTKTCGAVNCAGCCASGACTNGAGGGAGGGSGGGGGVVSADGGNNLGDPCNTAADCYAFSGFDAGQGGPVACKQNQITLYPSDAGPVAVAGAAYQ